VYPKTGHPSAFDQREKQERNSDKNSSQSISIPKRVSIPKRARVTALSPGFSGLLLTGLQRGYICNPAGTL
jgi:hypothetical protein